MKTLLSLNKSVAVIILLITSLCLQGNYSYSQGLGGLRDKVKKVKDDAKKTTDEAKKIKEDAKGQVDEVKKVTGAVGNGSGGSNANTGNTGSNTAVTGISNEKYYRITNVSTGQELAITLIYSTEKVFHTAIYESTIELKRVDSASDAQQWHLDHNYDWARTDDQEQIFTKVGYDPNNGGYTMWLMNPDSSNNPDDKINFLKMDLNRSETFVFFHFQKLSNGYYRIFSELSMPNDLNKRFEERRDKWNEPRSFQVVKVGGKPKIKQMKNADIDAQYWKLTELDYIPVHR
jgi:hypothetical protein